MYYDIVESGKRIKEMRKKAGMTQERLAEEIVISRDVIARIETGKNGTSVDGIINFANYFKVTTDEVLGIDSDNTMIIEIAGKLDMVSEDKRDLAFNCILGVLRSFI